ncbi:MAG: cyclase family protein [Acidobacteriota bacterium]
MKTIAPSSSLLIVWIALVAGCAEPARFPSGRVVDLTYPFDSTTIYWPTEPPFRYERNTEGVTEAGHWYASGRFAAAEHGGTHIDAPFHFWEAGSKLDAIDPGRLIGPGIVVDVSRSCGKDPDYLVTVDDLLGWEKRNGKIPDGAIVLLKTGFGAFYPRRDRYLGTAEMGAAAVAKLHFPGLHPDAARWIATQRSIGAIGLDTASIDRGQSVDFGSHIALFEHDIPALENIANLSDLPEVGFDIIALPMKIGGGTGGPLRIVAILP